eukprot:NODE_365_length_2867_cov_12.510933_g310_i0.p1 GENE.NODE_365_length_2867_cov_12.510933_g310_i0~~NODE_365_length_2867_cov_12.510933_g310_i0.p1  ORF type:complete len:355 (+),score=82.61 NODE_365_length_2867_cov_12.510933_g310_i0:1731-2795(+)
MKIVGKIGTIKSCQILDTKGKQIALKANDGFVFKLCRSQSSCPNGEGCIFAHLKFTGSPPAQDTNTIPNGFLLVEGELIKAKLFDETNGKKDALVKNKKGQLCTNKPCKFGLKCRYLHRKIDMRTRETITRLVHDVTHTTTSSTTTTHAPVQTKSICQICRDIVQNTDGISCPSGHFTCDECFSGYVEITWCTSQLEPGVIPDLICTDPNCGFVYSDVNVAKHTTESACAAYLETRQRARDGITMGIAQSKVESILKKANASDDDDDDDSDDLDDEFNEILVEQLKLQFPNALMCPNCRHGPVDFSHCSDLGAHHGQILPNGARIDNSCRNCGFFTRNRSEWLQWDGKLSPFKQ